MSKITQSELDDLWDAGTEARKNIDRIWSMANTLSKKHGINIKFWLDKLVTEKEELEDTILKLSDDLEGK